LTGGIKQKVVLAGILAMHPDVLLLDEPSSQLDPVAGEEILTLIRRLNEETGITVILTEQRLERCFHLADRIIAMEKGRIIYDQDTDGSIAYLTSNLQTPFIPPLARLFTATGFFDVPGTVKQARKVLQSIMPNSPVQTVKPSFKKSEEHSNNKECLVEVEKLWFSYPNGKEVLKDINFKIKPGDLTVLMGENGTGKTTLLKMINGLLKPSRGRVKILGKDRRYKNIEDLARIVGYLSQEPGDYLFMPTVREELGFSLKNMGLPDDGCLDELLRTLSLEQLDMSNPRDLSSGERQRVALASVLVTRPRLILLDEPTQGLDYGLKGELGKILLDLKRRGTAIFMITHDVEFAAEYASNIILMSEGSIVAEGNKYEMLSNSTFYSPQISRLFNGIAPGVLTVEEGIELLRYWINAKEKHMPVENGSNLQLRVVAK
jgi:energy-coupling factor transport system ATP-binding protein